ncbi:ankyrin repeat domain-containing protein [Aspergillus undulatus]|uniref:ankyrin repeat domain-containing protein n=1 Tax=Aspergillus undulatus TaxID=1810928 RepID=UPI003CCDDFE0
MILALDYKKMRLLDLPTEVLLCIADRLDHAQDISSLVRVARRTRYIFQHALLQFAARQPNCHALHYTARSNQCSTAKSLLQYGADVNTLFKTCTPLIVAAGHGSESVVTLLLEQDGISINARNENAETAIWCAAYAGHRPIVTRLLQCDGIQIDVADTWNRMTPFMVAVARTHVDVAAALVATGQINVNARDKNLQTPVHHAIKSQSHEAISLLLGNSEVEVDAQDRLRRTPLWYAVKHNNLFAAHSLLIRSADPNLQDIDCVTPLGIAILEGYMPMLKLLLKKEVNISPAPVRGVPSLLFESQPPVCLAVYRGNKQALRLLLQRGADVNTRNNLGFSPIYIAAQQANHPIVRLLLDHACLDINIRTQDTLGFTALHEAAKEGNLSLVNLLLTKDDIDINARDMDGRTPLWWTTRNNHTFIAKRLLAEAEIDVNIGSAGGSTPLHLAVGHANEHIVLCLFADARLDPNTSTRDGLTALGCAAANGDKRMMDLLLARPDTRVRLGWSKSHSPAKLAVAQGHYRTLLRLIRHSYKAF